MLQAIIEFIKSGIWGQEMIQSNETDLWQYTLKSSFNPNPDVILLCLRLSYYNRDSKRLQIHQK